MSADAWRLLVAIGAVAFTVVWFCDVVRWYLRDKEKK